MQKTCSRCGYKGLENEFCQGSRQTGWCLPCKRKYDVDYYAQMGEKRKFARYEVRQRRVASLRQKIFSYLENQPCVDCGETDPVVLEFDHRNPEEKEFNLAEAPNHTWERIKKELEKCDVRCANCHKRKTAKQQSWYKNFRLIAQ